MTRCRLAALLAAAFVAGMFLQAWRMLRMPIDEYHSARMGLEESLAECKQERDRDV